MGRRFHYPEAKIKRTLSVTKTGWDKAKQTIKDDYDISVSEMLEKIGIITN